MRERPPHVSDADVLGVVRAEWDGKVERVEHLPVGFGAHHWRASGAGEDRLFVTFDKVLPQRSAVELEAAYATTARLGDAGLEFVLASRPARGGRFTMPLGNGLVSCTRWVEGSPGSGGPLSTDEATATAAMLRRLHATPPPSGAPLWRAVVDGDVLVPALEANLRLAWETGPYGEPARDALADRLDAIRAWSGRYSELGRAAHDRRDDWVPTHGEPHTANQLLTSRGRLLVDWESLRLAPRERDLRTLVESGQPWAAAYGNGPDWELVELFDVEWRLDEIAQYAAWFAAPHTGTHDDRIAFDGLVHELERPEWAHPRATS